MVRRKSRRHDVAGLLLPAAVLLIVFLVQGCRSASHTGVAVSPATARFHRKAIERLMSGILACGFFKDSEVVRSEILDNDYGSYNKESPFSSAESEGRGCYSNRQGQRDLIVLHESLFSHFAVDPGGGFIHRPADKRASAILVHELAHDLWSNMLDEGQRTFFSLEAEEFLTEVAMAGMNKDKINLLRRAGIAGPQGQDLGFCEELLALENRYPDQAAIGSELYAFLAERAFSEKTIIPRQFQKFFKGALSEDILEAGGR